MMGPTEIPEVKLISRIQKAQKGSDTRKQLFGELWRRYVKSIEGMLRNLKNYSPEGVDKDKFLEEVNQAVAIKLLNSINTYRYEAPFVHWLGQVVRSCMLDERRKAMRYQKREKPVSQFAWPKGEEPQDEESETEIFDRLITYVSQYYCDNSIVQQLEAKEREEILASVLVIEAQMGKEEAKSAKVVKWAFWEDLTRSEIARLVGKDVRTVYRYLHDDLPRKKTLLAQRFGITDISQI